MRRRIRIDYYVVEGSTGKIMYGGIGFWDHDEAIMALGSLLEKDPDRDLEIVEGYYPIDFEEMD